MSGSDTPNRASERLFSDSAHPTKGAVFMESAVYRRNRLSDAARLLPVAAAILILFPAFMASDETVTSSRWIYFFAIWTILILSTAVLSSTLFRVEKRMSNPPVGSDESG